MKQIPKFFAAVLSTPIVLLTALLASGFSLSAVAQNVDRYAGGEDQVVLYEHCKFEGKSRSISVGEYQNMGVFDFDNDSVSSIRVPRGLEVTIYEHSRFRGTYARLDRDIYCFDKKWNDQVSSIRVKAQYAQDDRYNDRRDNYDNRDRRRNDERYRNDSNSAPVTVQNVVRVTFANRILQKTGAQKWQISDAEFGISQYRETSRDTNTIYLQNEYNNERVRIDLFANDITIVGRDGQPRRFQISGKQAAQIQQRVAPRLPPKTYEVPAQAGCFDFKAYTYGGSGGVRFAGHKKFNRFSEKPATGRICHNGTIEMEINKRQADSTAVIEINGRQYTFVPNEKETLYKNSWYRKSITVRP